MAFRRGLKREGKVRPCWIFESITSVVTTVSTSCKLDAD